MESRYRKDESLISLDLVELKEGRKDVKLYSLTEFGKEILSSIREEF